MSCDLTEKFEQEYPGIFEEIILEAYEKLFNKKAESRFFFSSLYQLDAINFRGSVFLDDEETVVNFESGNYRGDYILSYGNVKPIKEQREVISFTVDDRLTGNELKIAEAWC